ncbi:SpoIIIAH-like family protein [Clostridium tarantellae]|uniref:Stage III sporulation protein AH n=1 Tax=Clostridium tarantellae TaxID=39493 RepID=A0A6I1MR38_9CLOT|nr:SpoIIIAH-like family protein [Clostridium tarantellae]MPQ42759.1 stage III sporulation protein AH [Clostridium tarantellae]
MNRKQAGIILTLLALIICTGILASKVNSELKDGMNELVSTDKTETKEESTSTSTDYFYEARSVREQKDDQFIENLNAIIQDTNTSQEKKNEATETLTQKNMSMEQESRIEMSIKSKGFEDAVCIINDDKARVTVKNDGELLQEEVNAIQDIVLNVSKIYDVQIESK